MRPALQGLALPALISALSWTAPAAELEGAGALGIDLSFAPFFGRGAAPAPFCNAYATRPATKSAGRLPSSIERTADLGAGRRLVRLDRFGRKADYELSAALRGAEALVLDLRHNQGGVLSRMLRIAGRFTGPVPDAVRLVKADQVRVLAIPEPSGAIWRGRSPSWSEPAISSGEVLAAAAPARRRHRARRAHLGQGLRAAGRGGRPGLARPDPRQANRGAGRGAGRRPAAGRSDPGRARRARRQLLKGRARTDAALQASTVAQSIATGAPVEPVAPVIGTGL